MAEKKYQYTQADFPGGLLNTSRLQSEIQASSILTALDRIDTVGGVVSEGVLSGSYTVDIVFKDQPSQPDKTTLDGGSSQTEETPPQAGSLLAGHNTSANPSAVKRVKLDPDEKHTVEVQEVSPGLLNYRTIALPRLSINAASSSGSVTKSLPYDYYMLNIEYWAGTGSDAKLGDKVTCEIDPDRNLTTLLGALGEVQEAETTTDAEVLVAAQAIAAGLLQPGYFVKFASTANPEYEIVSIDTATNKITLDRNLENARSAGDDIFRTIVMGRDIPVMPANVPHVYGESKIGASKVPAGWQIRVTYTKLAGDTTDGREIDLAAEGGILSV